MDHCGQIIKWLALRDCEPVARKVQRQLQHMTTGMQSGDDSGLSSLWDEICVQMQVEQSAMWDLYTDIMTDMITDQIQLLANEQQVAIWLQTNEADEWLSDLEGARVVEIRDDAWTDGFRQAITVVEQGATQIQGDSSLVLGPLYETLDEQIERNRQYWMSRPRGASPDGAPPYSDEDVANFIMQEYLLKLASNWSNKRIERFIDQGRELD